MRSETPEADSPSGDTVDVASLAEVVPFRTYLKGVGLEQSAVWPCGEARSQVTKLAPVSTTNMPSTPLISTLAVDMPFERRGSGLSLDILERSCP